MLNTAPQWHCARTRPVESGSAYARAYAIECSCLLSGARRWPLRTCVESFEVLIKPFHEGHEPPPVGSLFFGAGGTVLEAFKLEAERGELLLQSDVLRDEMVVVRHYSVPGSRGKGLSGSSGLRRIRRRSRTPHNSPQTLQRRWTPAGPVQSAVADTAPQAGQCGLSVTSGSCLGMSGLTRLLSTSVPRGMCTIGVKSHGCVGLDGDFRLPHSSLARREPGRIPATGRVLRRWSFTPAPRKQCASANEFQNLRR